MKRYLPNSLSSRLILLMLLALALSQGVSLLVYRYERAHAVRTMLRDECLGRAVSAVQLMEATPADRRAEVLSLVDTPLARYWLDDTSVTMPVIEWQKGAREQLLRQTATQKETGAPSLFSVDHLPCEDEQIRWENAVPETWRLKNEIKLAILNAWNGCAVLVRLSDGHWLNMVYAKPPNLANPTPAPGYYVTLVSTVIIFSLAAWLLARHVSQPLRHLTRAAERFGRGADVPLLPEEGPDDIRKTMSAFNRMQLRLRRFVEDRTRMLAAIGHDLRTPITSLRLRAEFVQDAETRAKLLATLGEMQAMTEASLMFASSEATAEPTRAVEMSSLLESLCDDLGELGWNVTFNDGPGERITCMCRPDTLRRALRNLIENAVRYGQRARVSLRSGADGLEILIEDDGPGIPAEERERVFAPFVRLESSRNASTGGVGLGLSIARSIVRGHGGDIVLEDGQPGLRVRVLLPRDGEAG